MKIIVIYDRSENRDFKFEDLVQDICGANDIDYALKQKYDDVRFLRYSECKFPVFAVVDDYGDIVREGTPLITYEQLDDIVNQVIDEQL